MPLSLITKKIQNIPADGMPQPSVSQDTYQVWTVENLKAALAKADPPYIAGITPNGQQCLYILIPTKMPAKEASSEGQNSSDEKLYYYAMMKNSVGEWIIGGAPLENSSEKTLPPVAEDPPKREFLRSPQNIQILIEDPALKKRALIYRIVKKSTRFDSQSLQDYCIQKILYDEQSENIVNFLYASITEDQQEENILCSSDLLLFLAAHKNIPALHDLFLILRKNSQEYLWDYMMHPHAQLTELCQCIHRLEQSSQGAQWLSDSKNMEDLILFTSKIEFLDLIEIENSRSEELPTILEKLFSDIKKRDDAPKPLPMIQRNTPKQERPLSTTGPESPPAPPLAPEKIQTLEPDSISKLPDDLKKKPSPRP